MKFSIKNIGKVKKADIEIDAITVIGGDNDTGKSTVGRSLYTLFDSFYKVTDKIRNDRKSAIINVIEQYCIDSHELIWRNDRFIDIIASDILETRTKCLKDNSLIKDIIIRGLSNVEDSDSSLSIEYDDEEDDDDSVDIDLGVRKINDILALSDDSVIRQLVNRSFISEFSGQIGNLFSADKSCACLTVKNTNINVTIEDNQVSDIQNEKGFVFKIAPVYIDDPLVIDRMAHSLFIDFELNSSRRYGVFSSNPRELSLLRKLMRRKKDDSVSGEMLLADKFENIFSQIGDLAHGSIVESNNRDKAFKMDESDNTIELKNLSTGFKSFMILKQLIENGSIENRGLVIIDEPEVHLHPEWQLLYAELIVLLQKEFNLHVLINTHSPYFLRALEVYAAKHSIANRCKYYLSHIDGKTAVFEDCSEHVNKIYAKLAEPLNKLDRLKEEISYDD